MGRPVGPFGGYGNRRQNPNRKPPNRLLDSVVPASLADSLLEYVPVD